MSEANKDDALKCLRIARNALAENDFDKARKFGEKAQQLYPSAEVERFLRGVASGEGTSGSARPTPSASASPGTTSNPGMRTRTTAARAASSSSAAPTPRPDAGTPAQRTLIASILSKSSCYYDVLSVPRDADDEDIKKAYRKLALKLHPDKCQASRAEDAFKLVSKAFTCLTDPDRRAYYDRTGHEDVASAQAARQASGARGGFGGGATYYQQEMDPADLFNMMFPGMSHMFGRGPMGMNRTHGNPFQQQRASTARPGPSAAGPAAGSGLSGLINILPLLILLLVTFMANTSSHPVQLTPSREYNEPMQTLHRGVPYYVRDTRAFNERYPAGGVDRRKLEGQIDMEYRNDLMEKCRAETTRLEHYKRAWARHNRQPQQHELEKPHCELLNKFLQQNSGVHAHSVY